MVTGCDHSRFLVVPDWYANGCCRVLALEQTQYSMLNVQGCKLLSDIGQCPTKFGKCPSKSNFDQTLVRSQKKLSHYTFFAVTKSDCKFTQFAFCNKAFYLTLRRNGYTNLSRDLYIS